MRGPSIAGLEGSVPPTRRCPADLAGLRVDRVRRSAEGVDVQIAVAVDGRELDVALEPSRPDEFPRAEARASRPDGRASVADRHRTYASTAGRRPARAAARARASVVVSVDTVTPSSSVSSEPEGRSCVVSAIPMASPKSASTTTVTATRIQAKAFGMKRRPERRPRVSVPAAPERPARSRLVDSVASLATGARASAAEARPMTPQVSGSSKKPAYSSECTTRTRSTAASPTPSRSVPAGDEDERPGGGGEQPDVEREADDAELGEDRERRRVRRVAARRALAGRSPSSRAAGRRSPTPAMGRSRERVERDRDEPRASARDVLRRATADRRSRRALAAASVATSGAREEHDPRPAVGAHDGDREGDDEERDEARLRVREEEAEEEERDERPSPRPSRACARVGRGSRRGARDRHHEVAAVQARILEQRGHAEERRVRVRDLDVAARRTASACAPARCRSRRTACRARRA